MKEYSSSRTEQNASMMFESFVGILEGKMVFATNMFVSQCSNLLWGMKEIKFCADCYFFHIEATFSIILHPVTVDQVRHQQLFILASIIYSAVNGIILSDTGGIVSLCIGKLGYHPGGLTCSILSSCLLCVDKNSAHG